MNKNKTIILLLLLTSLLLIKPASNSSVLSYGYTTPPIDLVTDLTQVNKSYNLPQGFVYVDDVIEDVVLEVRYYHDWNFIGARVDGYNAPLVILTNEATIQLEKVQRELTEFGLGLKIYDGYRPQMAVNHFLRWSGDPYDISMQEVYYPNIHKVNLFQMGYLAIRSGHTRGSTVDLTLIDLETGEELDMGSGFDFLDPISGKYNPNLTIEQKTNRNILSTIMDKYGFTNYPKEFWHYVLRNEPYPYTYFNFLIE